jgi:hypothetical protein
MRKPTAKRVVRPGTPIMMIAQNVARPPGAPVQGLNAALLVFLHYWLAMA